VGGAIEPFVRQSVTPGRMAHGVGTTAPRCFPRASFGSRGTVCGDCVSAVLESRGITLSMSRKGNGYDNAPMESANGTIKTERVYAQR